MEKFMQKNSFFFLVLVFFFQSCITEDSSKQDSIGRPLDIIVSSDKETIKDLKGTISGLFEKPQPYFVFGTEPYFNSINVFRRNTCL